MGRSRFGKFRIGRKRYLDNWDILKSEDVSALNTRNYVTL